MSVALEERRVQPKAAKNLPGIFHHASLGKGKKNEQLHFPKSLSTEARGAQGCGVTPRTKKKKTSSTRGLRSPPEEGGEYVQLHEVRLLTYAPHISPTLSCATTEHHTVRRGPASHCITRHPSRLSLLAEERVNLDDTNAPSRHTNMPWKPYKHLIDALRWALPTLSHVVRASSKRKLGPSTGRERGTIPNENHHESYLQYCTVLASSAVRAIFVTILNPSPYFLHGESISPSAAQLKKKKKAGMID